MAESPEFAECMQRWRTAQAAATHAERRVYKTQVGFQSGLGPPASSEAVAEAAQLRAAASALFELALADVAVAAGALRST